MNAAISRLDQCDNPVAAGGAGPGQGQDPTPDRRRHLLPRRAAASTQQPGDAIGGKTGQPQIHVGRDTPANAAISTFVRPCACHNTIRARVATDADISELCTNARNSAS